MYKNMINLQNGKTTKEPLVMVNLKNEIKKMLTCLSLGVGLFEF